MDTTETVRTKREEILRLATGHRTSNVRLFGSVARAAAGPDSDVDILVTALPGCSLFDLGGLQADLEDLLGTRVDVVIDTDLKPRLRDRILKEAIPL